MFKQSIPRTVFRRTQCLFHRQQNPKIHTLFAQPLQARPRAPPSRRLQPCTQVRNASMYQILKQTHKEHPVAVTTALTIIVIAIGGLAYANYIYYTYIIGAFHKFPEPVAVKLRRALFYTNQQPDAQKAVKYYKEALQVADEIGMDPFSQEMIGVKLQFAHFFEGINNPRLSIDVLEIVRRDCVRYVEELGYKHFEDGKRTRVLATAVQVSIKLGELYSSPTIWDQETAQERLVWGVETALREQHRRQNEGVKEGEGEWMDDEQIGAALESLGSSYEAKGQFAYAVPLFLQALTLSPPRTCHRVILMNNLASSLAQQSSGGIMPWNRPSSSTIVNSDPPKGMDQAQNVPTTPAAQARLWAEQALELASNIKPPERTEECDMGCAVVTHNLGEIAEMQGKFDEARQRYQEAESLAKAIGFDEGVKNAKAGLKRLKNKP